jgi:hypothetical protein
MILRQKGRKKVIILYDRNEYPTCREVLGLLDHALFRSLVWELVGSDLLQHSVTTVVEESSNVQSVERTAS